MHGTMRTVPSVRDTAAFSSNAHGVLGRHYVLAPLVTRRSWQRGNSQTVLRTMAPDKSHLVANLNELLRLSDSTVDPEAAMSRPPKQHRASSAGPVTGVVSKVPASNGNGQSSAQQNGHAAPSNGNGNGHASTNGHAPATAQQAAPSTTARPVRNLNDNGGVIVRSRPLTLQEPESLASLGEEYHPSDGWRPRPHHLSQPELWERIREEARMDSVLEPALATFLHSVILSHTSMEAAMAFLLANKLSDGMMLGSVQLMSLFREVYAADPDILAAGIADMHAVLDRDPACSKFTQCMLQFKGYQAVQAYRITHHLWNQGRQALALAISVRVSELFAVDIHPAAVMGRGVMLDHATGIVIGETAVVGDNVSMLHHVSLGGSGTGRGVRHPRISHGVLLGAGVAVLGPVTVGAGSKVGAGSVVVSDLPDHCVAVGVPARIVKANIRAEPVREMDQCADFILDYVI